MSTYTADQFIGKTLFAKKDLTGYFGSPLSKFAFQVLKGQAVGKVNTWINKNTPDGSVWWEFINSKGLVYYVKHDKNKLQLNKVEATSVQSQEDKIKEQKEKNEKDEKGTFIYYLERYGKRLLIGTAVTYIIVQGVKIYGATRQNNKN